MDEIRIACGPAELTVAPGMGGGIVSLTADRREVLRTAGRMPGIGVDLAAIILVPFSNRIGGRGFEWGGDHFDLMPNIESEPFPIHGDGWQRAWTLAGRRKDRLRLTMDQGAFGPYLYSATQEYRLSCDSLVWSVGITNRAACSLPYGCGFHPWFPRDEHTRLQFAASHMWLNDECHLSDRRITICDTRAWDFRTPAALPAGLINNGYSLCAGTTNLYQGPDFPSLSMTFGPGLDTVIVFSPDEGADFLCVEPVSHPINAHNMPNWPGLVALRPGASMTAWIKIKWHAGPCGVAEYRHQ